ncbi:hypothetical protein P7K49_018751 [Saguinus oedipus]|uniref:Uncharacterized protein n=1 Tax=Saguinus oedipus TaxID=9490 RepID=A0ABQ9V767_SAGOE|nr:hypothetical protein P7K49_018751 [Saguinus oedipus]
MQHPPSVTTVIAHQRLAGLSRVILAGICQAMAVRQQLQLDASHPEGFLPHRTGLLAGRLQQLGPWTSVTISGTAPGVSPAQRLQGGQMFRMMLKPLKAMSLASDLLAESSTSTTMNEGCAA